MDMSKIIVHTVEIDFSQFGDECDVLLYMYMSVCARQKDVNVFARQENAWLVPSRRA